MNPHLRDAIESARSAGLDPTPSLRRVEPVRRISFDRLANHLKAVLRELPEDMTVRDLLDELEDRP